MQHGDRGHTQGVPDRLPADGEVAEMLANVELMKRSLEQVREIVQASIQSERAREGPNQKSYEERDDVPMYGDNTKAPYPNPINEAKRRRGVSLFFRFFFKCI